MRICLLILLDTNAAIFVMERLPLLPDALQRLREASIGRGILISPVSAWEIGTLARKGRGVGLSFVTDPRDWFRRLLAQPATRLAEFTIEIALASQELPGDLHDDPADRLLIATARTLRVPLMTRDRKILAYGQDGHVETLPC
jgi:PIN domain nuclease of toxin-antitoxin system